MNSEISETYINHPTWGLLYKISMVDDNQDLFTTLYAQRLFFLVANDVKGIKFQSIGRTEARMMLENRLRNSASHWYSLRSTINFRLFSNAPSNE